MCNITIDMIKKLRNITGFGILECKNSLIYSKGDIKLAIDNIKKLGIIKANKKIKNETLKGLIISKISNDNKYGIILEINCETDFSSKSDKFIDFCEEILDFSTKNKITDVKYLNNFFFQKKINLISQINENINLNKINFMIGDFIESYVHMNKIGVLLSINNLNDKNIIKQISIHIIANKPDYIYENDVPSEILINEKNIQTEIVNKLNKPENISSNIIKNKLNKFINEIVLINQKFIFNENKTIKQILDEFNLNIYKFKILELGL